MSHTQGPWSATNNSFTRENGEVADFYSITGPNCSHVCYMTSVTQRAGDLGADARLIAAAPELLEALQEVFEDQGKVHSIRWTDRVAAAIAKARGAA